MDLIFFGVLLGLLGVVGGFFAGLLGIGGGLIIVPGLYFVFSKLGYAGPNLMHLCVGTSLLTIVFTGMSSSYAHWKRGGVDLSLVRSIGLGIVFGVACAGLVAVNLHSEHLKTIFVTILFVFAGMMMFLPQKLMVERPYPHPVVWSLGGAFNAFISTFMGIGGATLNVPFMSAFGVQIPRAIGTAAALGVVVAVPGMLAFMLMSGEGVKLPPGTVGFVNVLAVAFIVPLSMLIAPVGAMLTHRLPVKALRKGFAVFMCLVALKMLFEGSA